ncbi:hypothetical protein POL82_04220 [Priestia aryabhattai]|uniref:hypothetical protein n=1 Tax=Priestia TaxID=2800373 RepID=UPI00234EB674|nr:MULTISPECIES: hypothetical protein [Priestia]MDC7762654.1 hypothetical protein [Priestia aryabhattai]MED3980890.1 hypothetical protein [Priestia megaterium]
MIVIESKDSFDWVALTSAIISFLAVVVAIAAIWIQQKQFRKQREPVIAPAIKGFSLVLPETHLDWDTGEELDDKFSKTTIPVYNYGGTTAFNIGYSYKFINLNEMKQHLDNKVRTKNFDIKIEEVDEVEESFDLRFTNDVKHRRMIGIRRYGRRQDLIQPGEKVDIVLPSYFLVLISYEYQLAVLNDIKLPMLELTVDYNDISNKKWMVKYLIRMDGTVTYKNNELKSSFIAEFRSKKQLDK